MVQPFLVWSMSAASLSFASFVLFTAAATPQFFDQLELKRQLSADQFAIAMRDSQEGLVR